MEGVNTMAPSKHQDMEDLQGGVIESWTCIMEGGTRKRISPLITKMNVCPEARAIEA